MSHKNVGIFAIETYFPKIYVDQQDLERHDNCVGKYTIGLGLHQMAVCTAYEDTASLALTAIQRLLKNYNIPLNRVGRIDVGTESLIDKSKSIKTVLMQLFENENPYIEGADSINACYGGTAALFNSLSWCDSSFNHKNQYAIVVASDKAIYDPNGSTGARATGGAGAVAILLGRDAPHIIFNNEWRYSYSRHTWDFYKPHMELQHPVVDVPQTLQCYMEAVDNCSAQLVENTLQKSLLKTFDYLIFHSPYYKLVEKAFARLYKNDTTQSYINKTNDMNNNNEWTKGVEKHWMGLAKDAFLSKVHPAMEFSQRLGNMYTPSVYAALVSLISKLPTSTSTESSCDQSTCINNSDSHNVSIFSYGSGFVSSMFGLTIYNKPQVPLLDKCFSLENLQHNAKLNMLKLNERIKITPEQFIQLISSKNHLPNIYKPPALDELKHTLFSDTYYLAEIDDKFRRRYAFI